LSDFDLKEQGKSMEDLKRPGRWKPGESGNPAGRAPGSGEVAKLRAAIREHVPPIIERLTEAAKAGDVGAARLLLERVVPPMKASEESATLKLPDGTLTDQGRAVLLAVAGGELAPGQGAALLASLGTFAKLREADDLERRITALEARHAAGDRRRCEAGLKRSSVDSASCHATGVRWRSMIYAPTSSR
jgi:hypothetical protein